MVVVVRMPTLARRLKNTLNALKWDILALEHLKNREII
jgi:hypothetical protein